MPRPQKYTDSDIAAAVQALIAEGAEVNPMRVRMRLGGGNVSRIKTVIAGLPRPEERPGPLPSGLPQALARELQDLTSETSQQILSVVARYWASTLAESAGSALEENAKLRKQTEELEKELATASASLAEAERQRDEKDRALKQHLKEKMSITQTLGSVQSALRNAESDFRAAQRMIDSFERNRREDREEIRNLQRRIEDLVGELAVMKEKAAGGPQRAPSGRRRRT